MSFTTALPEEYLHQIFSHWQKALEQKELCTIICPPFSGREYRILNFIDRLRTQGIDAKHIHLTVAQISNPKEIESLFENSSQPLLLSPAEVLLNQNAEGMLSALSHIKQKYHRGVLLFFEGTSITSLQKLPHYLTNKLFQNVSYLPYLDAPNSFHFMQHLEVRWDIKNTESTRKHIFNFTGGQMWLIKEIIRQQNQDQTSFQQILSSQIIQYKSKKIWETLPKVHKEVITLLANNQNPTLSQSELVDELQKLGILNLSGRIIPEFLYEFKHISPIKISFSNTDIFFNKVPVTSVFSKKEQSILRSLLEASQNKISRPQLAKKIWNSESDYSDWALDKAISRLRNKLAKLGIPKHNLITVRDYGYQLVIQSNAHEN